MSEKGEVDVKAILEKRLGVAEALANNLGAQIQNTRSQIQMLQQQEQQMILQLHQQVGAQNVLRATLDELYPEAPAKPDLKVLPEEKNE